MSNPSKPKKILCISFIELILLCLSTICQLGQISISCTIPSGSLFPPSHASSFIPFVLVCCIALICKSFVSISTLPTFAIWIFKIIFIYLSICLLLLFYFGGRLSLFRVFRQSSDFASVFITGHPSIGSYTLYHLLTLQSSVWRLWFWFISRIVAEIGTCFQVVRLLVLRTVKKFQVISFICFIYLSIYFYFFTKYCSEINASGKFSRCREYLGIEQIFCFKTHFPQCYHYWLCIFVSYEQKKCSLFY